MTRSRGSYRGAKDELHTYVADYTCMDFMALLSFWNIRDTAKQRYSVSAMRCMELEEARFLDRVEGL
jgi:hypothetical protein